MAHVKIPKERFSKRNGGFTRYDKRTDLINPFIGSKDSLTLR